MKLHVRSGESIATSLITSYLRSHFTEAEVTETHDDKEVSAGVRVELAGTDRWLFVAAGFEESAALAQAVTEGASAAISLGARPAEFQLAVNALLAGDALYLSPSAARWMAEAALRRQAGGDIPRSVEMPSLTAREHEVLVLVSEGLSNEEIARALTISANTVRTHLHSLALKLETTSRSSLIAKARTMLPQLAH
ncbi:MAG: response regulator transcription factor, partial [Dehalococcoidia bacterium]|nr:response regulator transcription factor [Dehalococcoidia bacterium]